MATTIQHWLRAQAVALSSYPLARIDRELIWACRIRRATDRAAMLTGLSLLLLSLFGGLHWLACLTLVGATWIIHRALLTFGRWMLFAPHARRWSEVDSGDDPGLASVFAKLPKGPRGPLVASAAKQLPN